MTDGANRTTDFYYDSALRLQYVDEGSDLTYEKEYVYNYRSQIDDIKSLGNLKIDYTYNSYGRLSQVIDYTVFSQASDTQIDYTYYGGGLRKEMTTPDYKLKYEYDKAMRLKKLYRDISGYKLLAEYAYNSRGQRTAITRYHTDGTTVKLHTEYTYLSNVGWLTYLENRNQESASGATVFSKFKYYNSTEGDSHDCVGNRLRLEATMRKPDTSTVSATSVYEYDKRYQLKKEDRTGDNASTFKWYYDDSGNRTYKRDGSDNILVGYDYNSANQLTTETVYSSYPTVDYTADYSYDDAGNMISKIIGTTVYQYAYNYENRLTSYDDPESSKDATYTYNVVGNRAKTVVGTTTTKFVFDGADCVSDYDGTTTRWYVTPGLDENLLLNNGSDYFYAQDGLGSVRTIVDASQNVKNKYDYTTWGEAIDWIENVVNRYTYTGREWDAESKSIYHRIRQNFPTLGRFGSRDPVESMNLYTYAANNPVLFRDPTGRACATTEELDWPCVVFEPGEEEKVCGPGITSAMITHFNQWTRQQRGDLPWWPPSGINQLEPVARNNASTIWEAVLRFEESSRAKGEAPCMTTGCEGTVTLGGKCISGHHIDHLLIMVYIAENYGAFTARWAGILQEGFGGEFTREGSADLAFNDVAICISRGLKHADVNNGVMDPLSHREVVECVLKGEMNRIQRKRSRGEGTLSGQPVPIRYGYGDCKPCKKSVPAVQGLQLPPIDPAWEL